MSYCGKCGTQLGDSDKVCPKCGVPRNINRDDTQAHVFEGALHKCPNCGAPVAGFQIQCAACGYEFRSHSMTNSVRALSARLEQIELYRQNPSMLNQIAKMYGLGSYSKASLAKANVISTFAIPNTKEDILEFVLLASSNIIPVVLVGGSSGDSYVTVHDLRIEQDAWYTKLEQAYNKAKLTFPNDPLFAEVERVYREKKNEISLAKKKKTQKTILIVTTLFLLIFGMFATVIICFKSCVNEIVDMAEEQAESRLSDDREPINDEDKQLLKLSNRIRTLIDDGKYDKARELVEDLHYDSSGTATDEELEEYWDSTREDYLEEIDRLDSQ